MYCLLHSKTLQPVSFNKLFWKLEKEQKFSTILTNLKLLDELFFLEYFCEEYHFIKNNIKF